MDGWWGGLRCRRRLQYAKSAEGVMVDPKIAAAEANAVFKNNPVSACLSGLGYVFVSSSPPESRVHYLG